MNVHLKVFIVNGVSKAYSQEDLVPKPDNSFQRAVRRNTPFIPAVDWEQPSKRFYAANDVIGYDIWFKVAK